MFLVWSLKGWMTGGMASRHAWLGGPALTASLGAIDGDGGRRRHACSSVRPSGLVGIHFYLLIYLLIYLGTYLLTLLTLLTLLLYLLYFFTYFFTYSLNYHLLTH